MNYDFGLADLPLDAPAEYALSVLETNELILNAAMWKGICNNNLEYVQEASYLMEETLFMKQMILASQNGTLIVPDEFLLH